VSPALLQRQAVLAAAALLATLGVLALRDRPNEEDAPLGPRGSAVRWESAVVGVLRPEAYARATTCGTTLNSGTLGVSHPVLPCGVDLVVALDGQEVRTEVVDHAPVRGGREFDLTQALAEQLGVQGRQTIRWRFAG
jgi:rare lipoprotein A (RlpA)-like double-psi beta-barrel protein